MLGRLLRALARLFSSLALSTGLLAALALLTWLGTLEQVHAGLHDVQQRYFESWLVVHRAGPLPLPLPGGQLVLTLLFANLAVGGILRLRRDRTTRGIVVVHAGMALLLVSGFVKLYFSEEGHATLYEGQVAGSFQSYYRWELAIAEDLGDGRLREHLVPEEDFRDAAGPAAVELVSAELPFALRVGHFLSNCRALPKGPMFEVDVPVVDGQFLRAEERLAQAEANVAGLYADVVPADGSPARALALWGLGEPAAFELAGRSWTVALRKERYPLPFTLALERFTKIDHPRSTMPKSFSSDVRVREGSTERAVTISMNEPLRTGGLVLYQASWGPANAPPGAPLFSTFAVVRNPADSLPLYACLVIAAGLCMHFGRKLARWVQKERARTHGPLPSVVALGRRAAALLAVGLAAALPAQAAQATDEGALAAAIAHAERLPIQDGGRVKPLSTFASFTLLRLSGRRSLAPADGAARTGSVLWLLEVVLRPDEAAERPIFLVQTAEVVEALGLAHGGKRRRDRYSFAELEPGVPRLFELAHEYGPIEAKQRTTIQQQIYTLAGNVDLYLRLAHGVDFARAELEVPDGAVRAALGGRATVGFAELCAALPELEQLHGVLSLQGAEAELARLSDLLGRASAASAAGDWLAVLPPAAGVDEQAAWLAPGDVLASGLAREPIAKEHLAALAAFEALARAGLDAAVLERELGLLAEIGTRMAGARGEGRVGLELAYYKAGLLSKSLALFVLAFLLVACAWLRPQSARLWNAASLAVLAGALLLVLAIAWRCLVRGRPPVSTLYETVLFVTAVGALVALATELVSKQRIALSAAALLGTIGLFVANGYELLDKQDTMPSLVAVLDTNFWLATHVTSITIGYSAGMLAALLASLYLIAKALRLERADRDFLQTTGRMVYGVLCFGLIFSVVGTILGGIWANDSWGRFWGWDPKENGALLICLTQTAILHARRGGILREHGVCVAAAFGGTVVAFSWWGVNLLGVGLHSYGFTSGIQTALWTYYGLQWSVVLAGLATALRDRRAARRSAASAPDPASADPALPA